MVCIARQGDLQGNPTLARVEGQVVLPAVLRRFTDLSLVDAEPSWRPTFVTRQLATLPVKTGR